MLPFQHIARVSLAMAATAALVACSDEAKTGGEQDGEQGHAHSAQFGGEIFEIGGDHFAHIEVVHDADTGEISVYTLDGHAEKTVTVPENSIDVTIDDHGEEITLTLPAPTDELMGNEPGENYLFRTTDSRLEGIDHFDGVIASITVMGKMFENFEFTYGSHDHDEERVDDHDENGKHDDGDEDHGGEQGDG